MDYERGFIMAKKTLWQKIDRKVARYKILRNSCLLTKEAVETDLESGQTTVTRAAVTIPCTAPQKVSEHLTDTTLVHAGDMSIEFDYLTLLDIAQKSKPPIPFSIGTGIFNAGTDKITFGGVTYGIRSISPQDWQNNQPGAYIVYLKNESSEEAE